MGQFSMQEMAVLGSIFGANQHTRFDEQADGPHKYLTVNSEQPIRFQEAMVQLVMQPPL